MKLLAYAYVYSFRVILALLALGWIYVCFYALTTYFRELVAGMVICCGAAGLIGIAMFAATLYCKFNDELKSK